MTGGILFLPISCFNHQLSFKLRYSYLDVGYIYLFIQENGQKDF